MNKEQDIKINTTHNKYWTNSYILTNGELISSGHAIRYNSFILILWSKITEAKSTPIGIIWWCGIGYFDGNDGIRKRWKIGEDRSDKVVATKFTLYIRKRRKYIYASNKITG